MMNIWTGYDGRKMTGLYRKCYPFLMLHLSNHLILCKSKEAIEGFKDYTSYVLGSTKGNKVENDDFYDDWIQFMPISLLHNTIDMEDRFSFNLLTWKFYWKLYLLVYCDFSRLEPRAEGRCSDNVNHPDLFRSTGCTSYLLHTVHCTVHNVRCTPYTIRYTTYGTHRTLQLAHCTLHMTN